VKRLVEAHAGTVHAESELGHGARFVISLPASQATAA
jgi:signal transduction histidine kinase